MIFSTKRARWMMQIIEDSFRISDTEMSDFQKVEKNEEYLRNFLDGQGSRKFMVYHQVEDLQGHEGGREANAEPYLFVTHGDQERLKGKAVVFIRNLGEMEGKKGVKLDEDQDSEVLFLEVN